MLTFFTADQVPLTFPSQVQATGSEGVTTPSTDCIADLWPQLDRMMLTSCRRTPSSNLRCPTLQCVDSQDSLDANMCSGNPFNHSRQELPGMNQLLYTTEPLSRISAVLEDVICDEQPLRQSDPPAQPLCMCNGSPDQSRSLLPSSFRPGSGQTPLFAMTRQHRERLNRLLGDLHLADEIITLPCGNARKYPGKQDPVLKRIRLRRASKRNSSRARKSING